MSQEECYKMRTFESFKGPVIWGSPEQKTATEDEELKLWKAERQAQAEEAARQAQAEELTLWKVEEVERQAREEEAERKVHGKAAVAERTPEAREEVDRKAQAEAEWEAGRQEAQVRAVRLKAQQLQQQQQQQLHGTVAAATPPRLTRSEAAVTRAGPTVATRSEAAVTRAAPPPATIRSESPRPMSAQDRMSRKQRPTSPVPTR